VTGGTFLLALAGTLPPILCLPRIHPNQAIGLHK